MIRPTSFPTDQRSSDQRRKDYDTSDIYADAGTSTTKLSLPTADSIVEGSKLQQYQDGRSSRLDEVGLGEGPKNKKKKLKDICIFQNQSKCWSEWGPLLDLK